TRPPRGGVMAERMAGGAAAVKKFRRHDFATIRPADSPAGPSPPHTRPVQCGEETGAGTPTRGRRAMRFEMGLRWLVIVGLLVIGGAGLGSPRVEAQDGLGPPVALGEAGRGSLLVKTGMPGRFVEAPLLRSDVRMQVTGLIARVEVAQQFANPTERWLEAVYVFPLPESAAVDTLLVRVGPRVIEGQIREREEARQAYQVAQQEGKKASLLEQERPNIFTVSVANIGPGEQV